MLIINLLIYSQNLSRFQILQIINTHTKRNNQLKLADDVILNDGNVEKLRENILVLHQKYIKTCIVSKTIS